MSAVVAIVGRPNVGKSTLFNRLLGQRKAIECDEEGTTRDPVTAMVENEKVDYLMVDTGGLEFSDDHGSIEEDTQTQAKMAAREADVILFCIDTKEDITRNDELAAEFLRKNTQTPVFMIGTKADNGEDVTDYPEIFNLGINEESLHFISCTQNRGVKKLKDTLEVFLYKKGFGKRYVREEEDMSPPRISFFGRPNVGKSSIINALLQKEECIVSDQEGTTRDSKDIEFIWSGKKYILVDTAGVRKRKKVDDIIEKFSVIRSFRAIANSDIVVYLVDAEVGITALDQRLMGELKELHTGVIVGVNKWDLRKKERKEIEKQENALRPNEKKNKLSESEISQKKSEEEMEAQRRFLNYLARKIPYVPWAPVIFTSALERKNITKIFPLALGILGERKKQFTNAELNSFLEEVTQLHPPSGLKNTRPRMKFITQIGLNPPAFKIMGSKLDFLHWSYQRYLEHRMRDAFGFEGTGIIFEYKNSGSSNPYDKDGGKKNWRAVKKGNFKEENL